MLPKKRAQVGENLPVPLVQKMREGLTRQVVQKMRVLPVRKILVGLLELKILVPKPMKGLVPTNVDQQEQTRQEGLR